jgi:hypothetical protein
MKNAYNSNINYSLIFFGADLLKFYIEVRNVSMLQLTSTCQL